MQKFLRIFALVLTVVVLVTGCNLNDNENSTGGVQGQKIIPVTLTVGKWTNGGIVNGGDEQWFKFTATASTQNVYIKFGSFTKSYVYVYDGSYNQIGDRVYLSGSTGYVKGLSKSLIKGAAYYIKVTGYNGDCTGKYWIGFTDFPAQPETVIAKLVNDRWTNGNVISPDSGGTGEQWFKFVATASSQRVYVKFSTMNCIAVALYDSSYNSIGNGLNTSGDAGTTSYMEKTIICGETYYIKVTSGEYRYDGRRGYTGKYWIGVTDFPAKPETSIIVLRDGRWASGKIESESNGGNDEQWFKFIATSSAQRIYVKFGTMNCIAVGLYDSNYNSIGSDLNTSGDVDTNSYIEKNIIYGETYYLKVTSGEYRYDGRRGYTGTYWIAFNSTGTAPQ